MPDIAAAHVDRARRLSLRYLNLFRLVIAGLFLVAGRELGLGSEARLVYDVAAVAYLVAVLALGFPDAQRRLGFDRLVTLQVIIDIVVLSVIMAVSGGYRSGMAVMMMVVVAGAGLVSEGRMVLFYAASATLAVLIENTLRSTAGGAAADFFQVGVFCAGFFGIAIVARLLALRAKANASLAVERGIALARQRAVNEQIIRDMEDGVLVVDGQWRVSQSNPRAAALLGFAADGIDSLRGRMLAELAPELAVPGGGAAALDGKLLRLGRERRLIRCRAVAGVAGRGTSAGANTVLYLTDYEDILRELQQVKLAALGRLTASIAHEIRNPLSAVTQAADLLLEEKRSDMQARLVRMINDNARRIERMVRDVLMLSRRDQPVQEALPLAEFVHEVIASRAFRNPAERELYAVAIDPALTLAIDRAHLHQILDNLLSNAVRHCSGAPGAVRLTAQADGDGGAVRLHVCDDGPGLDDDAREHLFEPFYTSHPKGTGLGLYIARELAEANGVSLALADAATGADFVLAGRSQP